MRILINGKEQPEEEFADLSGQEIVKKVNERWPDCIIEKVIFEGDEVPLIYFQEEVESSTRDWEVEFILSQREEVVKRELERVKDYLPRLEATVEEMSNFFAGDNKTKARKRYRSALEGMEWMQTRLVKVVRMKEDEEIKNRFQDELREYHRAVKEALIAYQQGRDGRLCQLFEEEILFYLHTMLDIIRE